MPKHQPVETIARGLATHGSRVLLCRSKKHQHHYLPGGHIEFGEPARAALTREIEEEAGLGCEVGALLLTEEQVFTQNGKNRHEITLIFHITGLDIEADAADSPGAEPPPVPSVEDHIEFVWVDLASVPDLVIYPESTKAWLASGGEYDEEQGAFLPAD